MQLVLGLTCLMGGMATQAHADDRDTTTKVSGVIGKIQSGRISVATSWGRMSIQSDALANAKAGDQLTLWGNGNNVAADHHAKGKEGIHRLITGKLTYASGDKTEITLMTPEGGALVSGPARGKQALHNRNPEGAVTEVSVSRGRKCAVASLDRELS